MCVHVHVYGRVLHANVRSFALVSFLHHDILWGGGEILAACITHSNTHARAHTPERNRVPFICECTSPVYAGYDLPPPLFPCLRTLLVNASRGRGVASLLERERLSFVERKNTRVNNRNKRGGRKREEDRIREFRDYGC